MGSKSRIEKVTESEEGRSEEEKGCYQEEENRHQEEGCKENSNQEKEDNEEAVMKEMFRRLISFHFWRWGISSIVNTPTVILFRRLFCFFSYFLNVYPHDKINYKK